MVNTVKNKYRKYRYTVNVNVQTCINVYNRYTVESWLWNFEFTFTGQLILFKQIQD